MGLDKFKKNIGKVMEQTGKVVVGQQKVVEQILIAILCDGNAVLEGYPGLGKTLTVNTLAKLLDLKFARIQHTPDLMPSDITGTHILEDKGGKREFKFQPGPIFTNVLLADEINRATPKTQSALLEAMQEKQVTIGNTTYQLDPPFFVLATQNPIEQEGTYPLPEAQLDRFLLKIKVDYPTAEEEGEIVNRVVSGGVEKLKSVLNKSSIYELREYVRQMPISKETQKRAINLVNATRNHKLVEFGASPRASIGLVLASKANALLNGRNHVSNKDINEMAFPVLRHRIILNFEAARRGMTTDDIIKELIK